MGSLLEVQNVWEPWKNMILTIRPPSSPSLEETTQGDGVLSNTGGCPQDTLHFTVHFQPLGRGQPFKQKTKWLAPNVVLA